MRSAIALVTVALSVALLPAQAQARSCHPRGAYTVARSRHARVFAHRYSDPGDQTTLFGCLFSRNRAVELADGTEAEWSPLAALAGRYAGIAVDEQFGEENPQDLVQILDLRNGHIVMYTNLGGDGAHLGSLVIRRNRAAAWIQCSGDSARLLKDPVAPCRRHDNESLTVYERPSTLGRGTGDFDATALDEGDRIDPFSLRLHGSTLSWMDGGVKRQAPLR